MRNALRQLTLGTVRNTAGRNSQGRITAFHRGGGSKRLQRKIDLKRTNSSMGIVERIEYDPNRSSRIALVRWMEGVQHKKKPNKVEQDLGHIPPTQTKSTTSATVDSIFSCSSLKPVALDRRQISATFSTPANEVVVGLPGLLPRKTQLSGASKISTPKDVFISAFSKANGENAPAPAPAPAHIPFPRIAVAGAKPNFFAPQLREEIKGENEMVSVALAEVRKWTPQSIVWQHRNKPKAALSWKSLVRSLGLAGVGQHNLSKHKDDGKTDHGSGNLPAKPDADGHKDGESGVERTPVSYIIASNHLEPGKMVMNCDLSKSSSTGHASAARHSSVDRYEILDLNSQIGNCVPLTDIRIGTWVHNIECKPGQGAKLARSAGTSAKVIKEPGRLCHLRLPSGVVKLVDSRCRATIGTVSNPTHNARKLRKAGHSRWLGIRPTVRGVAMNPVDHPHGGGEGRTSGGRPSVSPWGKPTKAGYKTAGRRRRHSC